MPMGGRQGQSIVEYAIMIAVVIAALMGMRKVMVAHLGGGWRAAVDQFGHGHQYERDVTSHSYTNSAPVSGSFF